MEPAGRPEDLFELLEQLGKGSYGAVYKARHRPSGTIVAVKVIPLSGEDEEGLEDIRREIAVLQECVHPNVVRYFGSFMGNEYLWIRYTFSHTNPRWPLFYLPRDIKERLRMQLYHRKEVERALGNPYIR